MSKLKIKMCQNIENWNISKLIIFDVSLKKLISPYRNHFAFLEKHWVQVQLSSFRSGLSSIWKAQAHNDQWQIHHEANEASWGPSLVQKSFQCLGKGRSNFILIICNIFLRETPLLCIFYAPQNLNSPHRVPFVIKLSFLLKRDAYPALWCRVWR